MERQRPQALPFLRPEGEAISLSDYLYRYRSAFTWTDIAQRLPGPISLGIYLGRYRSAFTWTDIARHLPGPISLGIYLARYRSAQEIIQKNNFTHRLGANSHIHSIPPRICDTRIASAFRFPGEALRKWEKPH